jgi:hypothetical protein
MVDYSKWDKFADSDSDEDENSNKPLVQHFNQPTSITIGPTGPSYEPTSTSFAPAVLDHRDLDREEHSSSQPIPSVSASSQAPFQLYETPTHNWQQTRYDVTIWIKNLPYQTKVSDLKIDVRNKKFLCIQLNSSIIFFEKEFKYEINETNLINDGIDWEIISNETTHEKHIKLIFQKHQYLPGSVIWWNACFVGDEEIDVMAIPERKLSTNGKRQKQEFSTVWKEANELFQKKIQQNERCSVELEETEERGQVMEGK